MLAQASSLLGWPVKDFSGSRFRQPPHRAPAGGARCDRGSPPAPRHVHATRDRGPARCGGAERHAALAPASPADRRPARDGTEARGMDALALAISATGGTPGGRRPGPIVRRPVSSWAAQPWRAAMLRTRSGASRPVHRGWCAAAAALACLLARRPWCSGASGVRRGAAPPCAAARRSNIAAPPCPAMPSRHVRCLPDQTQSPSATVEFFPVPVRPRTKRSSDV